MNVSEELVPLGKVHKDLYRDEPLYPNQELILVLPIPPSINHMYISVRGGKRVLTPKAKQWFSAVQRYAYKQVKQQEWKRDNDKVWYHMDIDFYFPDRRRRDTHNCLKILMDALEGVCFDNDYYVLPRCQRAMYNKFDPHITIRMKPCPYDKEFIQEYEKPKNQK